MSSSQQAIRPLCVDLDNTLVKTDTLFEGWVALLSKNLFALFSTMSWLILGRASLKEKIAKASPLDPQTLPYNEELISYLKQEKAQGRKIVLATAAHEVYAKPIAEHLGLFDQVICTKYGNNVKGNTKAKVLIEQFGEKSFDYIGDAKADIPVWKAAASSMYVGINPAQHEAVLQTKFEKTFNQYKANFSIKTFIKLIRVHQWVKNLLIFVPLLLAHQINNFEKLSSLFIAFFSFSFGASSLYIINDLLDIASDRQHASKKFRPIPAGIISIPSALAVAALLFTLSICLSLLATPMFFPVVLVYCILSFTYSTKVKKIAIADILFLAGLYTVRIFAGGIAAQVEVSEWLLAFSMFFFLSLACVKRYAEISGKGKGKIPGRGYTSSDEPLISQAGIASGYLSVLVLAFYINNPQVTTLYVAPAILWVLCPLLLYWITRIWLIAHRGLLHHDPIVFALKDKTSYAIGIIASALLIIGS